MEFKIGDLVSVLDDNISGRIVNIHADEISIETEDGFEMNFTKKELIKDKTLDSDLFKHSDMDTVLQEKEQSHKKKSVGVKPKERNLPAMEVDLHIHQLTTSHKNMSNHEMLNLQLDTARHKLEFAIKKRIQKLVFIHGVGEGVLKMELDYLFGRYENVKFYAADYQKYGLGATEVYIFQNA
ncbi:DNA mismatch repair protein MutS [Subsaximicrobium wynnwilliamsii]|uniref:DNA mismatch repair protein MutS n=1 Tax=Subsaximicrobium wynnwilliamsii TaxID=291179 RepID=A0A5C6ZMI7_9FLAO|nr:DNA mismatch repair protein MutS [Subsaximicrobium wynnwilliamsii]TXD85119.1 DNA mismatch repair protein MutS [Subsaximicrobium wynnwilliamsii]TXD91162.1 DNA mismatch repair protein MutS [Subsaximicrobium wynnwilliamsii]TXE04556.1 DNA mismatch repair protein MutS [Subsaximicrobium wynnwilliamsii]